MINFSPFLLSLPAVAPWLWAGWMLLCLGHTLRQWSLCMVADRSRKNDLVRSFLPEQVAGNILDAYRIRVLVPCLTEADCMALPGLLQSLETQTPMPVSVDVVTPGAALLQFAQRILGESPSPIQPNWWVFPEDAGTPRSKMSEAAHGCMPWLIERCLTSGDGQLFVFLRPDDRVKPDFCRQVTARLFDRFVIQGQLLSKPGQRSTWLGLPGRVAAWQSRWRNRVQNPGRYYQGQGAQLQASGWAAKQEVLELVPFPSGPLEEAAYTYTLYLALTDLTVAWAPHAQVYRSEWTTWREAARQSWQHLGYAMARPWRLTPVLLSYAVFKRRTAAAAWLPTLFYAPGWIWLAGLCLFAAWGVPTKVSLALPDWLLGIVISGDDLNWAMVSVLLGLEMIQTLVARSHFREMLTALLERPVADVATLFWGALMGLLFWQNGSKDSTSRGLSSRRASAQNLVGAPLSPPYLADFPTTSQDPASDADSHAPLPVAPAAYTYASTPPVIAQSATFPYPATRAVLEEDSNDVQQTLARTLSAPLTNQQGAQVLCQVTAETSRPDPWHRLCLRYKTLQLETPPCNTLQEAYQFLYSRLAEKQLTLKTCGSCGYFWVPPNGGGFCLYGKQGQPVDPMTDAVSVLSPHCQTFTGRSTHVQIFRAWEASLTSPSSSSLTMTAPQTLEHTTSHP
jgi:hypothetical protein